VFRDRASELLRPVFAIRDDERLRRNRDAAGDILIPPRPLQLLSTLAVNGWCLSLNFQIPPAASLKHESSYNVGA
jgi:hypothetical protein